MTKRAKIHLSEREKTLINHYLNKSKRRKDLELRMLIVLKKHQGLSYLNIKKELQCSEVTISNWLYRWSSNYNKLQVFTKGIGGEGVSDAELLKEICVIFSDAPRCGHPLKFTEEIQKQIQALACKKPEDYSIPVANWTHKLLAQQVVALKITDSISARQIGRILKKTTYLRINQSTGLFLKYIIVRNLGKQLKLFVGYITSISNQKL